MPSILPEWNEHKFRCFMNWKAWVSNLQWISSPNFSAYRTSFHTKPCLACWIQFTIAYSLCSYGKTFITPRATEAHCRQWRVIWSDLPKKIFDILRWLSFLQAACELCWKPAWGKREGSYKYWIIAHPRWLHTRAKYRNKVERILLQVTKYHICLCIFNSSEFVGPCKMEYQLLFLAFDTHPEYTWLTQNRLSYKFP